MPTLSAKLFSVFLGIALLSCLFGFHTGNYWKQDRPCFLQELFRRRHPMGQNMDVNNMIEVVQPLPSITSSIKTGSTVQNAPPRSQTAHFPDLPGLRFKELSTITIDNTKTPAQAEAEFYNYLRHTDVVCAYKKRLGHVGDGGWDMCMVEPFQPETDCLVYSFGINHDWSFDDTISNTYNCAVRAFDPSIALGQHIRGKRKLIKFYPRGLGGKDGTQMSSRGVLWELKTFASFKQEFGDSNRIIDYLKIDVERSEWGALRTMLKDGSLQRVKQIGFEIHTAELKISKKTTTVAQFADYYSILLGLEKLGFRKWRSHSNPRGMYTSKRTRKRLSCCFELIYINANFIKVNT